MNGALSPRALVLLCLACLLGGWMAWLPESAQTDLVRARRDVWSLPELPRPQNPGSQTVIVASASMWGPDLKPAAGPPPEDLRWRLAGVFGRGRSGGAVVMFENPDKQPLRLKVGDKLPEGQVIEAVEGNELVVRNAKKKLERLAIERRD